MWICGLTIAESLLFPQLPRETTVRKSTGLTAGAQYMLLELEPDSDTGLPGPPHLISTAGSGVYPGKV